VDGERIERGTERLGEGAPESPDPLAPLPLRRPAPAHWRRERLLAAMVDEVAANGYEAVSVVAVCARAGVSPTAFGDTFRSKEECFLTAFDSLLRQLAAHAISAYHAPREPPPSWEERLRAGLTACVAAIVARADAARAYLLAAPALGSAGHVHRELTMAMFEDTIAEMLRDLPYGEELGWVTVTGVAGGIWRAIETRLHEDRAAELPALVEPMLAWVLAYVREPSPPDGSPPVQEPQLSARDSRVV